MPTAPFPVAPGPVLDYSGLGAAWVRSAVGTFDFDEQRHELTRLRFIGPSAGHDPIRLGLFAGVHGDEPAGCVALLQFAAALAAEPTRAAGYDLYLYPVVNPTGYALGRRENFAGKDLNREFWRGSTAPEVVAFEAELRRRRFDGLLTLHSDDTSHGCYGYSHGRTLDEALLKPALRAAERYLPRDQRAIIDGFGAHDGLICDCYNCVLSAPPDQRPRPFDVIFETPALASFDLQVSASVAALDAIIAAYRGFIAYAQDL